jgi:hypothetical protein
MTRDIAPDNSRHDTVGGTSTSGDDVPRGRPGPAPDARAGAPDQCRQPVALARGTAPPETMPRLRRALDRAERVRGDEPPSSHRCVDLPAGPRREPVTLGPERYQLRGSEVETLTAVGTFRSVFARDLEHYADEPTRVADLDSLHGQHLIDRRAVAVKDEPAPLEVVTLTAAGQRLLEAHRAPSDPSSDLVPQQFYAGWVRAREVVHDASVP